MDEKSWCAFLRWRMCSLFGWTPAQADEVIADRARVIEFYAYIEAHGKAGLSMEGQRVK